MRIGRASLQVGALASHLILIDSPPGYRIMGKTTTAEERDLQAFFDHAPYGVFVVDGAGRYLRVNAAACHQTGYSESELLRMSIAELAAPETLASTLEKFTQLQATGLMTAEFQCVKKDGTRLWIDLHATRLDDERFLGFSTDITERKRLDDAVRDRERKLAEAQRVAKLGHWELDPTSQQVTCSDELLRIFQIDRESATLADFAAVEHPEDRELDLWHIQRGMEHGIPWDIEHRLLLDNGTEKTVHTIGAAQTSTTGKVSKLFGTVQDITERKHQEAERARLEAQLRHGQKLESLGLLAGGIAHDFNNLLMGIIGNTESTLAHLPHDSPARPYVEDTAKTAEICASLSNQMLAYSGKGAFVTEFVDRPAMIEDMANLLRASISKKAALEFDLPEGLPGLKANPAQLRQLIMNLIINASEALGDEQGQITIRAQSAPCESTCVCREEIPGAIEPGDRTMISLEVSDTGCGMDDATQAQIFDPFFSTKFSGRGLGLAAVHGIVRGHQAGLEVDSKPGRGTTIRVHFPIIEEETVQVATLDRDDSAWTGAGTVLLADDEPIVRQVVGESLRELGFDVISASDGESALALFDRHGDKIVCAVLDLTMPKIGGEQVYATLRERRADLPVLLSSGYSQEALSEGMRTDALAGFLQKPFKFEELQAALRSVLGE